MKQLVQATLLAALITSFAAHSFAQDAGATAQPSDRQAAKQAERERKEAERRRKEEEKEAQQQQPGVRCTRYQRKG